MSGAPSQIARRRLLQASAATPVGLSVLGWAGFAQASHDKPTMKESGVVWPAGQALPHFAAPTHLDVADITGSIPDDERVLFTTLQGVVNRERPSIYLLHEEDDEALLWLSDLAVPFEQHGRWDLLAQYVDRVSGIVIWDPEVEATINVATTLAGIHGAVAVSPRLARTLAITPYGLKTVSDLRGRFENDWAAYTWQFRELWEDTTNRMLVALDPDEHFYFRDYAVAVNAMVTWLEVNDPAERELLEQMMGQADDHAPYVGWFASDIDGEFAGTELVSQQASYVIPADWFSNGTVFGGVRTDVADSQPSPETPALENKIYVTMTMGEGDNLQYNQHHLRELWADEKRGSVPINWTTSPLLIDAAPVILEYFQRTATENDYFVAGPSGAGYIYPTARPLDTFSLFTEQTGEYMAATGMDTIQILNRADHDDVELGEEHATQYAADAQLRGWFIHHTDHTDLEVVAGLPQATTHLVSEVEQAIAAIHDGAADWDGRSPRFVALAPLSWDLTPSDLAAVADSLDSDYVVVRGDHFFDLAREALGLPPLPG